MSAKGILKRYWGYDHFRPMQEEIIESILSGHDTLALLPTGGGKSICFQVPALMREGVCIVISPLIALMKDQVEQLRQRKISAVAIYSGMSPREIDLHLDNCVYGNVKFLYVSPERLKTEIFIERAKRMHIGIIAVDEAHCISQWGYDFRPPYLEIADFRSLFPEINIIALTATATKEVKQDIQDKLSFKNAKLFQKSFARANLSYAVRKVENKEQKLLEILRNIPGTAIIYARSRKRTQAIAQWLQRQKINSDFYHAGLKNEERSKKQENWITNKTRVIVATNAFGMGIDKPDVRVVVHVDLPDNLEAYYQEAGRAGRDEKKAYAVILYDQNDIHNLQQRVEDTHPDLKYIRQVYQSLANYYRIAVGSSNMASYDFDLNDFIKTYHLSSTQAYYALQRLEEHGLIQLSEAFFVPSKLHILIDHTEMYKFQVANARLDLLTKALQRLYGGESYVNFINISESELAKQLKIPQQEVKKQLKSMADMDVIAYYEQKDKPQITFMTPRFDAGHIPISNKDLTLKKSLYKDKVDAVVHYTEHQHRCRTQLLLEYFDEISYDYCGVCDICVEKKKQHSQKTENITQEQYTELNSLIKSYLTGTPTAAEKLISDLQPSNKAILTDCIRIMLDQGELYYDGQGRLAVD
ncbi:RecQ family ATP-dependent DNA helicase [Catalinimonas niigatensis]|uniref:RecQ family ATP-dependent DNA helicase n=1 Tax=Catalinimonas niigatensis TaxID=1397264 RepID=UPI0026668C73|nr:ATP-dependent DNA helicase RecQ [Catalinimonas niigatensis]WPP52561.1 ATP-dependent DNA helicase RecQ [Catalinimonas niigatensis]